MMGPKRQKIHFPNPKAENDSTPHAKRSSKNLDAISTEPIRIQEMREVL